MNTWILRKDLERAAKEGPAAVRPWAQKLLEHDKYPVASVVLSPDRVFLGMAAANDIMRAPEGMTRRYLELLQRGVPF